jgi:CheY-like chemotaxis protein
MGSDFNVESSLGQGSNFSFELLLGVAAQQVGLPAARPNSETQAGGLATMLGERGAALRGARILVAEDHVINQKVLKEFLELCGISVDLAGNGQEALSLLQEHTYDAVLMDVHMPVMSGLATTEYIRRNPAYKDLPIIALSAGVTQEEREKCLASGMNDFVVKPIQVLQLIGVLCQQLGLGSASAATSEAFQNQRGVSLSSLKDLPGFDFSNTLDLLDGDESFLIDLLNRFRTSSASTLTELDDLLGKQEFQAARDMLHGLEGGAANLGANSVELAAAKLYLSLKQDRLNQADYVEFRQVMMETLTALESLA